MFAALEAEIRYRCGAPLTSFESGGTAASLAIVAIELKEIAWRLTREEWANSEQKQKYVLTFMSRLLRNACAAINARCNMTIYFGVKDDGRVAGIFIESLELVHALNEILNDYLRSPKHLAFKANNSKPKFLPVMRSAFGECVSRIMAIPVDGAPPEGQVGAYYVLEVDVCPKYVFTKNIKFSYCDPASGKPIRCIRVGSSVLPDTHPSFKERNAKSFEGIVEDKSEWRKDEDLALRRGDLMAEEEALRDKKRAVDVEARRRMLQMIEAIDAQLDNRLDMRGEELDRVLSIDAIAMVKKAADMGSTLGAVIEVTADAWSGVDVKDLQSIATTMKEQHQQLNRLLSINAGVYTRRKKINLLH